MRRVAAFLLLTTILAACTATVRPGSASPPSSVSLPASASPSAPGTPTSSPTSAEPSAGGSGSVVVTFRTSGDEEFRILLTDRDDIRTARRLLAGDEENLFPNGLIVRDGDGGVNTGYSWHIDPESVEFAEFSIELCDGRPSYVEDGTHTGGDRFCPWSAVVVAIEPAG